MKPLRAVLVVVSLFAATLALAQTTAQKSFDQLKTLTGSWEGKKSQGEMVTIRFREVAAGSALMSEIQGQGAENMVSMIHLDGPNRLMLTHYCGAGNQPRMIASTSADGKTITFDYFDATNLASPDAAHMQRVVFTIINANHHTEEWTFNDHGKEIREVFDLHGGEVAPK
jgi:YD repeat-containing protein